MSERYWITGVQLGMLLSFCKSEQSEETKKLVDEIIDKQFVGQSTHEGDEIVIIKK